MGWAGKVIVGTFLVTASFVTGVLVSNDDPPPVPEPVVKEVTKYVDRTKTIEKRVMPQPCRDLVAAATVVQTATDRYEAAVGDLPRILDDTYRAIYNEDLKKLNELKKQSNDLQAASIKALLDIRDAEERIKALTPKCTEEVN